MALADGVGSVGTGVNGAKTPPIAVKRRAASRSSMTIRYRVGNFMRRICTPAQKRRAERHAFPPTTTGWFH